MTKKQNILSKKIITRSLKAITPPIISQITRLVFANKQDQPFNKNSLCLYGDFKKWDDAVNASMGYDNTQILEKTRKALLKVKKGEAVYERDSVLFDSIQYSWPLLAGLMRAATSSGGVLNVLDFGGSLGSTYFQNIAYFKKAFDIRWNVVEQKKHVEVGREYFETEQLRFYDTIDECVREAVPTVIILSGVLQYLENPEDKLAELCNIGCNDIIIDRTSFWKGDYNYLAIQNVPAEIYPASYPIWVFSFSHFLNLLRKDLKLVAEFDCLDRLPAPIKAYWKGLHFERK